MTSKLTKLVAVACTALALGTAVTTTSAFVVDAPAFARGSGGNGGGNGGGAGGGGGGGAGGGADGFASPHYIAGVASGGPNARPLRRKPQPRVVATRQLPAITCQSLSPTSATLDTLCRSY
jgi:hypothetical protein